MEGMKKCSACGKYKSQEGVKKYRTPSGVVLLRCTACHENREARREAMKLERRGKNATD